MALHCCTSHCSAGCAEKSGDGKADEKAAKAALVSTSKPAPLPARNSFQRVAQDVVTLTHVRPDLQCLLLHREDAKEQCLVLSDVMAQPTPECPPVYLQ